MVISQGLMMKGYQSRACDDYQPRAYDGDQFNKDCYNGNCDPTSQTLDLSYNRCGRAGLDSLLDALTNNISLTSLGLARTGIDQRHAALLIDVMAKHPSMPSSSM